MQRRSLPLLISTAALLFGACSFQKPEATEWGCSFGKGPLDNKELKNVIPPGGNGGLSNDTLVTGPADQRVYVIDADPEIANLGANPVVLISQDASTGGAGVAEVSVEAQINFVFNERFCDWYIQHGNSNTPLFFNRSRQSESGWQEFLRTAVYQNFVAAARPVVADYSYADLYIDRANAKGEHLYAEVEQRIAENLVADLAAELGNDYFCGPDYAFDGNADGVLESGCPPLEVSIHRIVPVDAALRSNLEAIAAAHERVLTVAAERELGIAQAEADLEVATAREAAIRQEQVNAELDAIGDSAFCRQLAESGIDCSLLAAAENGADATIIVDPGADPTLLIDADPTP